MGYLIQNDAPPEVVSRDRYVAGGAVHAGACVLTRIQHSHTRYTGTEDDYKVGTDGWVGLG